ncbi:MAG TPA: hypothetical protein VGD64_06095, partial [Acidisarcina sp.]
PMLWHAVRIGSREQAVIQIGNEIADTGALAAKYRPQTLYLLLPLVTLVAAIREGVSRQDMKSA